MQYFFYFIFFFCYFGALSTFFKLFPVHVLVFHSCKPTSQMIGTRHTPIEAGSVLNVLDFLLVQPLLAIVKAYICRLPQLFIDFIPWQKLLQSLIWDVFTSNSTILSSRNFQWDSWRVYQVSNKHLLSKENWNQIAKHLQLLKHLAIDAKMEPSYCQRLWWWGEHHTSQNHIVEKCWPHFSPFFQMLCCHLWIWCICGHILFYIYTFSWPSHFRVSFKSMRSVISRIKYISFGSPWVVSLNCWAYRWKVAEHFTFYIIMVWIFDCLTQIGIHIRHIHGYLHFIWFFLILHNLCFMCEWHTK